MAAPLIRALVALATVLVLATPTLAAPRKKPAPRPPVHHSLFMSGVVHKTHRAKPLVVALAATPKPKPKAKPRPTRKPVARRRLRRRTHRRY